jgi:DNA mismatch repair protein MutH
MADLYDDSNVKSIMKYASNLVGKSFSEILEANSYKNPEIYENYSNSKRKGRFGNLLEKLYFKYDINSKQDPDFSKVGVELKVSPYEITDKDKLRAGERLVLTMISFNKPVENDFYKSHAWKKMQKMLLIYYFRNQDLENDLLYKIGYVGLFTPPKADLLIIINDYKKIIDKISSGKADELSESDTMYLGACTKGATAKKSLVTQYYGVGKLAKRRAFCFKQSYMTYLLNHYLDKERENDESIIKDSSELSNISLDQILISRINSFRNKTDTELANLFDVNLKNKSNRALLTYKMLGINGNKSSELIKANIIVKTIKLNIDGKNKESFRLFDFKFNELIKEKWESSQLNEYLDTTQFLFVIYQDSKEGVILKGCQIWHMNEVDKNIVGEEWIKIKNCVNKGIQFCAKPGKYGTEIIRNNLPKSSDSEILHIRPHEAQTFYIFPDGSEHGNGSRRNSEELPDGQRITKHSYWLNRQYINKQIENDKKG